MKSAPYEKEIKQLIKHAEFIKEVKPDAEILIVRASNTGGVYFEPKILQVCDTVADVEDWLSRNHDKHRMLSGRYTSIIKLIWREKE